MRSTPVVIVVSLVAAVAATGCHATQAQRSGSSSAAVAAGAALVVAGLVVTATAEHECKDIGGICPNPVSKDQLLGAGMMVAGGALVVAGLYGGVGQPAGLAGRPAPRPAADPAACVEWQRSFETETDPWRRDALRDARPSHCAPAPAAPDRAAPGPDTSKGG